MNVENYIPLELTDKLSDRVLDNRFMSFQSENSRAGVVRREKKAAILFQC